MQRKSTLAYGSTGTALPIGQPTSRRRRLDATGAAPAPRSTPSSSPPSGLRLVQPRAVPRPTTSSVPPEPTSIRAVAPRVALPRPARLPSIPIVEDDAEQLDDADLTFVEDVAPPPAPAPRAPTPPVPWTAESTPIPANQASASAPPPSMAPAAPAAIEAGPAPREPAPAAIEPAPAAIEPAPAAIEAAPVPRWIAPPAADLVADDLALAPPSPLASARARLVEAWAGASPRARTAFTFAAGFVAGAVVIGIV